MEGSEIARVTDDVRRHVTGFRKTNIDGIDVCYFLHSLGSVECWVDCNGRVYVAENLDAPEDLRRAYRDLIAYHEHIEFDWLKETGLPVPRYRTGTMTEKNRSQDIHSQVHYMELMAAEKMGILDDFVAWRSHEPNVAGGHPLEPDDLTLAFYEKIKSARKASP